MKFKLMNCILAVCVLLTGCAAAPSESDNAETDSSPYLYDFTMEDLSPKMQGYLKDLAIFVDGDTFSLFDIDFKVNSVAYTSSVAELEDNFYELPSEVQLTGQMLDDDHLVVLVSLTMTNTAATARDFYLNSFRLASWTGPDSEDEEIAYAFYRTGVEAPVAQNRKYFRVSLKPQVATTVTVGFIGNSTIPDTRSNFLKIGTTGSTSDPTMYIPLPKAT